MKSLLRIVIFAVGVCAGLRVEAQLQIPDVVGSLAPPNMMVLKTEAEGTFTNQDKVLKEMYDLFVFDLQFSGAFNVIEQTPQADLLNKEDNQRGTVNYTAWKELSVNEEPLDYLAKAVLIPRGPDFFQLNLFIHDVRQGQRVIGTAYGKSSPFELKNIRQAGHQATAETISYLTNNQVTPITQSKILFVNQTSDKKSKELYIMDYDGWQGSVQRLTFFNSVTLFPDWSPDGNEVAYVSYKDGWPDAYIHNLVTGKVSLLANFRGTNNTPRWFPDGRQLAISLSAHGNPEIYIIPKEGKKPNRITNNRSIDVSPDVSPDGTRIAFISERIGSPQLYTMNTDGTNTQRLSFIERKCDTPSWSPVKLGNDYMIAFTGFYTNLQGDIFIVDPAGGAGTAQVTDGAGDNKNPTWSPNAQYIAFSSNRLGKTEIFLASSNPNKLLPNGKRFHRLTYLPGDNLSPAWSPK